MSSGNTLALGSVWRARPLRRDKPFAAGVETRLRSELPHRACAPDSKGHAVRLYPRASGLEPQQERAGNPHPILPGLLTQPSNVPVQGRRLTPMLFTQKWLR